MSRYHSYLRDATTIIETFTGKIAFALHLKQFFAAQKKYGSTDRKQIAILCYDYFRVLSILPSSAMEEKLLQACFLCRNAFSKVLAQLQPDYNEKIEWDVDEKAAFLGLNLDQIFPFSQFLGKGINKQLFSRSFLKQPLFFIRFRPGKAERATMLLNKAGIPISFISDTAVALPQSTTLNGIIKPNRDAVIQDLSSQQVLNYLKQHNSFAQKSDPVLVWDCCAASGGKSILVYDILQKNVQLTVSDIRESALEKLKKRLQQAIVPIYKSFTTNLTLAPSQPTDGFDLIICDAPCSGSGTWGRTPDQMHFFLDKSVMEYSVKQKKIVEQTAKQLNKNGLYFYITCSVFEAENEAVVNHLEQVSSLKLLQQYYITGYDKQADTMFVAVFTRS